VNSVKLVCMCKIIELSHHHQKDPRSESFQDAKIPLHTHTHTHTHTQNESLFISLQVMPAITKGFHPSKSLAQRLCCKLLYEEIQSRQLGANVYLPWRKYD
jgi:hypothetical protein